ncbi:MAG: hypothetical protein QOI73_2521 [Solirubrobacteraceae bacterium]|nr:hypothetical protein [Solirubrobacteraceae bacterium]
MRLLLRLTVLAGMLAALGVVAPAASAQNDAGAFGVRVSGPTSLGPAPSVTAPPGGNAALASVNIPTLTAALVEVTADRDPADGSLSATASADAVTATTGNSTSVMADRVAAACQTFESPTGITTITNGILALPGAPPVALEADPAPNTLVVATPTVQVTVNEQTVTPAGELFVTAMHIVERAGDVIVNDIIIAGVHCGVNPIVAAPAVTTDPATALTNTGATLHSTINPNGSATTYRYEYGRNTSFGTVVGDFSAGAGSSAVSQSGTAITGLSPATTYYYRVAASNAARGETRGGVVAFTTTGAPTAPTATTAAATAITNTGAGLHGTMNAHGSATAYAFEWGTSLSFGHLTPPLNGGSTTADLAVVAGLIGLVPNQTYLYRLVATNAQGTTHGAVMAFTTTGPATAPSVTTGAASPITFTGARLSGTVNPRGSTTAFTFEYGTTTNFGNISAVDNAGSGATTLDVGLPVAGLAPGTTYLYRLVASNAAGTTLGPVQSFTTPAT